MLILVKSVGFLAKLWIKSDKINGHYSKNNLLNGKIIPIDQDFDMISTFFLPTYKQISHHHTAGSGKTGFISPISPTLGLRF
jgi:hypothetical protein